MNHIRDINTKHIVTSIFLLQQRESTGSYLSAYLLSVTFQSKGTALNLAFPKLLMSGPHQKYVIISIAHIGSDARTVIINYDLCEMKFFAINRTKSLHCTFLSSSYQKLKKEDVFCIHICIGFNIKLNFTQSSVITLRLLKRVRLTTSLQCNDPLRNP